MYIFTKSCTRSIIIDIDDLQDIEKSIYRIYDYWFSSKRKVINDAKSIEALIELIGRSWEFKSPLRKSIQTDNQYIAQYTEQQFILLDHLQKFRRALICGCAGSGKTFLAAEKAKRLKQEGFSVILLCWNEQLAIWLDKELDDFGIEAKPMVRTLLKGDKGYFP